MIKNKQEEYFTNYEKVYRCTSCNHCIGILEYQRFDYCKRCGNIVISKNVPILVRSKVTTSVKTIFGYEIPWTKKSTYKTEVKDYSTGKNL